MTARHSNRGPDGKFARADGKPTLHRQVEDWAVRTKGDGLWVNDPAVGWRKVQDCGASSEPPTPSVWPAVFFIVSLILVAVMGIWLAAVDAKLVGGV